MKYVIAYDFGTTGVKSCLFDLDGSLRLVASAYRGYELYVLPGGGAEEDADEWWDAMCATTRELIARAGIAPESVTGLSFCSQMQGLVLVDEKGTALRRPMSYMDQRAQAQMRATQAHGLTVSGVNIIMLLKSLAATHAASTSVKDPLWKYKWVQECEPEVFSRVHKWLDVKEYLIGRCTGEFVMTPDSAYSTFLYDTRPGHEGWSHSLCKMYGVDVAHLPRVIACTDVAGTLTAQAAEELGLAPGTPVYGGGGDATMIGLGAGCTDVGETHVYSGTSGWVGTVTDKQVVDVVSMIAAILMPEKGRYNYFAEMETAGKCFEWVKDHLVLDEVNVYLEKIDVAQSKEAVYESLYDYMSETVAKVAPGASGVIFTPWLHGNRCPFEAPEAAGMFFNIHLETGKAELLRAVLEGICFHLKWMLECEEKKIKTADTLRFVGGGALSEVTCQMLADITGRRVETVEATKDVGAIGAALLIAVGSGQLASFSEAKGLIRVKAAYEPDASNRAVYDKNYAVFKELYKSNKKNFARLNRLAQEG